MESVRDPGNIGTIVRSARAFGIDTLILSDDCADLYSPKTMRASMGALFVVKTLRTKDMVRTLADLREKGYRTYAATLDEKAATLPSLTVDNATCFVVGNEGHGLSGKTVAACGNTVYIPMAEGCESLNASIAASLLMWEVFKARDV